MGTLAHCDIEPENLEQMLGAVWLPQLLLNLGEIRGFLLKKLQVELCSWFSLPS